jgi:hypothetical protein
MRSRGRRQPNFRTRWYHVEGDAQTVPSRCARTASVPIGTCRYSSAVTMSLIARTSRGVRRYGATCPDRTTDGQAHTRTAAAASAWKRLGDNRRNRRSARNGTNSRARSTARRILILARASARRSCVNLNPELRSRARASRRSAVNFLTRRRSSRGFLLEFRCLQVRHVQAYRDPRCLAEPATRRRTRNPEICGDGQVPGAVDEIDPEAGGRSAAASAAKSS